MRGRGLYDGDLKSKTGFQHKVELEEKLAGKSKDFDALALYTNSFPAAALAARR